MCFRILYAIAVLLAGSITLSACNNVDSQSPTATQVSVIASAVTVAPNGEFVLNVTVRLYNPTSQPVQLLAGTPCSVFRWTIVSADKIVQTKPNQLCVQVVAIETLPSHSSTERQYEIMLDGVQYRGGKSYILRYQFWGHDGTHVFTLTDV